MSFVEHFSKLEDPRSHINRKHDLMDILFLSISAVMSGAEGWKEIHQFGVTKLDWLRRFRPFDAGIPVDDTIARVIRALEPAKMMECFVNWVNEKRGAQGSRLIAIDGKTFRHAYSGDVKEALHTISVWSKDDGLVLGQYKSKGKKNEIETVQEVIELLELKGATVTLDAMHCQTKTAAAIRKQGGDYVLCVKNNQKGLREELDWWFDGYEGNLPPSGDVYEETDAGHGRVEHRRYEVLPVTEQLEKARKWKDAKSIVRVRRERHAKGKITQEVLLYISSLEPNAKELADAIRGHWEVENKLHWVLDVTFREDDSRIRIGDGAENVGILRRFCLNLAKLHPKKDSMKGKLRSAGWNDDFRAELLFGVKS